jgi:hypothetical protein
MTKKSPENCKWPRTDRRMDGQRHNIICLVFWQVYKKLEIVFIKNKCLPQLPKLTVLQQNPPIFNVLVKLEEKAWAVK